ncbi:1-deoxy-D-xylulose-5-phosphate synthase [Paratractidigestivibacter sp.]|uniref:1-deoxy-D-xylulose-5-phosphate synthase n=1 Tax=Paratractidigestivibacter sp. TaxID=2847316 RepID=UPI002ACB08C6|nr:1-deoxy-D-xylulose-5-phosphate synthase [Paratractidigestivibacter sp.]
MYLEHIQGPEDVKKLATDQLAPLCDEIRRAILDSSAIVGGHVASNLASVELTVALHRVFDSPADKIVFDVSHQCYAHKMLTGRAAAFLDPMSYEDVSGFTNPRESEHDHFSVGHTSTAASLACGLAKARDLVGGDHNVVAVIGDGSLSGGLAFEGLDWAAEQGGNMIFVINDNEWSIAPDAGGLYRSLAELRQTQGKAPDNYFRSLGLDYRYLADGHDVLALEQALFELRGIDHPCVLHIHTQKGRGYAPAEADPEGWHHVGPFDVVSGTKRRASAAPHAIDEEERDYAQLTGGFLLRRMAADPSVVAISAATPYIMGFGPERREAAGKQFVDVGIAEEHAVTYATALAAAGARPVLGVYGTFLQRAFDELMHDAGLNAALVTILVFGCSVYGTSDATHLGFFDIPMLGCVPGLTYLAPTCAEEYLSMLDWSLSRKGESARGPVAIRVPAASLVNRPSFAPLDDYASPAADVCGAAGARAAILALGDFYPLGKKACRELSARGVECALVNPRCANAVDGRALASLADGGCELFATLEDGCVDGGFGARVAQALADRGDVRVRALGLPKAFADRYDASGLLASCGLTPEAIADLVESELAG